MTVRVTLQLPESVFERLAKASAESGRSLNQVMVDALRDADLQSSPSVDANEIARFQRAIGEIASPWADEDDALMAMVFPDDDPDAPVLTHEQLWEMMPRLPPEQWASKALLEDREDRI
jgi:hypothetical protein